MKTERLDYIDIARGTGTLLVVAGHSITVSMASTSAFWEILRSYIYIIHMPLFFVISGILFEKNKTRYGTYSPGTYCRRKAWLFMIPYLSFSVLNYGIIYACMAIPPLAQILRSYGYSAVPLPETLLAVITYIRHQDTHLWFVYVMFLVLIINRTLLFRQTSARQGVLLILYFISVMLPENAPVLITYTMQYLFLFSFGRALYSGDNQIQKHDRMNKYVIICVALHIAAFSVAQIFPSHKLGILHGILILTVKCTAAFLILTASQAIENPKITAPLKYLGNSSISYVIYLIHMPFLTSALIFILSRTGVATIFVFSVATVLTIILCILFYNVVYIHIRLIRKYFFGTKK